MGTITPAWRRPLAALSTALLVGLPLSCDSEPGEPSWRSLASLPDPRRTGHVAGLNGKLYYIGGDASLNEDYVSTTFGFDPSTGVWFAGAAMPTARGQGAVAVLGDRIHVIGGVNPAAPNNVDSRLRVHEAYDPATNTWQTLAPMSFARGGVRADTLLGRIYVVGGSRGTTALDSVEVYDAPTNSWSSAPSLPSPRFTFGIGSIGGRLYVAGGEGSKRSTLSQLTSFDPGTSVWFFGRSMPKGRHRVASGVLTGRLIVLGGLDAVDAGRPLSGAIAYNVATNAWSTLPRLPVPLVDAAAAVLNGELYVLGGIADGNVTDAVFVAIP